MHTGGCNCGAVRFTLEAPIGDEVACHCTTCRRLSGFFWAAFDVPSQAISFDKTDGLTWYESSNAAKRGFCNKCGASMFYKLNAEDRYEIAPGAIDGPLGAKLTGHIFIAQKGDYYDLNDNLPQQGA